MLYNINMIFRADKIFWNRWILWIALVIAVILYLTNHRYTSIAIVISVIGIISFIFRNNYFYYLSEHTLIAKGDLRFRKIALSNIIGVRLSRHPFFMFAPFKLLTRVKIKYTENGKVRYLMTSPHQRDLFIEKLMEQCSKNY